jgi:hypothetical protein
MLLVITYIDYVKICVYFCLQGGKVLCVFVNIERNFQGFRRGFDILKRFSIGIVTINRHDCWTFIIAYQIIFCANLVYDLHIILDMKFYHRALLFCTLMFSETFVVCKGIACFLRVFNGPLTTRVDTTLLCICINLMIFKIITNE